MGFSQKNKDRLYGYIVKFVIVGNGVSRKWIKLGSGSENLFIFMDGEGSSKKCHPSPHTLITGTALRTKAII